MSPIERRFHLATDAGALGLNCTSEGATLAGVPLLCKTPAGFSPRPAAEIGALMKAAYGRDIDPAGLTPGLEVIAEALNRDDLGRSMIAALRLRLPELDWEGAVRVAHVDQVLTKYDPSEARDARGRWTAEGGAGLDNSTSPEATSPDLRPDRLKPILVSNPSPPTQANDNDYPTLPPKIIALGLTELCIKNARDPGYQNKVEQCATVFEECGWLAQLNARNPQRKDICAWPDGSVAVMKFGFLILTRTGSPF